MEADNCDKVPGVGGISEKFSSSGSEMERNDMGVS